jgi:hypothetical protein
LSALLLCVAFAFAGTRATVSDAVVLGVNVTFPVAAAGQLQAPGFGLDVGYQFQGFNERDETVKGEFTVWAEEVPALNYGPVVHIWRADGAWNCSLGARLAVAWPLRVGTLRGWIPGPALGVEVGPVLSTAGYVGFDGAAIVDLPWVEGRLGITWVPGVMRSSRLEPMPANTELLPTWGPSPWRAPRLQLGVFSPLALPENWEGSQWRGP